MSDNILLCDMGGTHARFARLDGRGEYSGFLKYKLNEFDAFGDIVSRYMADTGLSFDAARFAVARQPDNGVIRYKRFAGDPDYEINFPALEQQFGWADGLYLNDLEAAAHGTNALKPHQVEEVVPATKDPVTNNKVVISVGTGVGHAGIYGQDILKTAGGHYLPVTVTPEQRKVEGFIREHKDVSLSLIMEDFVSARGLRMITEYVTGHANKNEDDEALFQSLKSHPDAIRLFFEFLGLHAHNLVSVFGFYGGLYLAGGVIDHLVKYNLTDWDAFTAYFKPPMLQTIHDRMDGCAVHYVLHDELPLLGLTTL